MRELEGECAELGPEDIAPVESVGNPGEPVDLGRHIDGMAVACAQRLLEFGLRPRRPELPTARITAPRQQRLLADVAAPDITGDAAAFCDRREAKRVCSQNGGHDHNLRWYFIFRT
jgi:hypothetical protein